ncbi:zinc finger CCCH domain-containing protein 1-like [Forsythia ovata]|uniref:Zinc finger CCCH domain-containing protein 1-like n=1 Tax=Forsythia ovata TaxID=205694 RepID=A0ABD1VN74_9LAMI
MEKSQQRDLIKWQRTEFEKSGGWRRRDVRWKSQKIGAANLEAALHIWRRFRVEMDDLGLATATLETETEFSIDARAIRKRVINKSEEVLKGKNDRANTCHSANVYKIHPLALPMLWGLQVCWHLENEWNEREKARAKALSSGMKDDDERDAEMSDEDDDDSLPFACFICSYQVQALLLRALCIEDEFVFTKYPFACWIYVWPLGARL